VALEERSLAPVEESIPRFVLSVAEMQQRVTELQQFIKSQMVRGVDYGKIPGTPKPTLYKPGAEKLAAMYGFAQHVEVVSRVEDWERGFFHYEVRVDLINKRTGVIEAQGVGSANSRETRYRWRWVPEKDVPAGVDKASLPTKRGQYGPLYRIDNETPADVVNTLLKMAKKRGLVDAVLSATRSSGLFTQDAEDFPDPEDAEASAEPTERARSRVREAASRAARRDDRAASTVEASRASEPVDPHTALRRELGRLGLSGPDVRRLLAPMEALEVAALSPDQAAHLASVLAGMEPGEGAVAAALAALGEEEATT